jgi:hypothetical protein
MPNFTRWVFTFNNPTIKDEERIGALVPAVASYLVFGRETAPQTGTPHFQGFIIFKQRIVLNTAIAHIGHGVHLEPARGTSAQCITPSPFTSMPSPSLGNNPLRKSYQSPPPMIAPSTFVSIPQEDKENLGFSGTCLPNIPMSSS